LPLRAIAALVCLLSVPTAWAQTPSSPIAEPEALTAARKLAVSGDLAGALRLLDRSASREAGWPTIQRARAEFLRGQWHRVLARSAQARDHAQRARQLAQAAGDSMLVGDATNLLADLAYERGDYTEAERLLLETAPHVTAVPRTHASLLYRLGLARVSLGRGEEALDTFAAALSAAKPAGNPVLQAQIHQARSLALLGAGDYDGALHDAETAYNLLRDGGTLSARAQVTFSLAQAHAHIHNLDRAAAMWTEAIELYEKAKFPAGVALGYRQRTDTWFAMEDYDRAAADGEKAIALLRAARRDDHIPPLTARLALIAARRGDRDSVARYARDAEALLAAISDRRALWIESDLALVALEEKQYDDAFARFERTRQRARTFGDIDYEWRALFGLGRALAARGEMAAAEAQLQASIAVVERMRRSLPSADLRAAFLSNRLGPFDALTGVLLDRAAANDDLYSRRALEIAERGKARSLAELLREARMRLGNPQVAAIRDQELAFGRRLSDLQKQLASAGDDRARAASLAALEAGEREYEAFTARIRRESPAYAALAYPEALSADTIVRLAAPGEALVMFWIGRERGAAWVIRDGQVRVHAVPGRLELEPKLRLFNASLQAGAHESRRLAEELYTSLFAGVALDGVRRLVIVPDGPLWRLPFSALRTGGDWLVRHAPISIAPSATLLATLRDGRSPVARPALVLARSIPPPAAASLRAAHGNRGAPLAPLTNAAAEARDVARTLGVLPEALLLEDASTEAALKRAAGRSFGVVHVAAHAYVDDALPRRSAMLLKEDEADDGLLQLNEIAALSLDADLVVLAACRTNAGRSLRGEGLMSLSRAFMFAGARAIAASLWDVDDRQTRYLMREFYAALRDGAAPDQALRVAQLQLLQQGGAAAAPAHWAAFVVLGAADVPLFADPPSRSGAPLVAAGTAILLLASVAAGFTRRRPSAARARG
jgi:CHAT domain-containing protein